MPNAIIANEPAAIGRAATAPRRHLLLGASGLAIAVVLAAPPASALDECGAAAPGGTVTCSPAGNTFPGGIQYKVDDLTIVVQDGVIVDTTGKAGEPGGIVSGAINQDYGNLTIKAGTAGGSGVTITTDDDNAAGISAASKDGGVTVTAKGDVATRGTGASGLLVIGKSATVTWTGDVETTGQAADAIELSAAGQVNATITGAITTHGSNSTGIDLDGNTVTLSQAGSVVTTGYAAIGIEVSAGAGGVTIDTSADISTAGGFSGGIRAFSNLGAVTVSNHGDITTQGLASEGIYAHSQDGAVTVTSDGNITTFGKYADGIDAYSKTNTVRITNDGAIATHGEKANGIRAQTQDGAIVIANNADISAEGKQAAGIFAYNNSGIITIVNYSDITTVGDAGFGIFGASANSTVIITTHGAISTKGESLAGIYGASGGGAVTVTASGAITTKGEDAGGIVATALGGAGVTWTGDISTAGEDAFGIYAISQAGLAAVTGAGSITTQGDQATGISAHANNGGVTVSMGGSISTAGEDADGILAVGKQAADVTLSGSITTKGDLSNGVYAASATSTAIVRSFGTVSTAGENSDGIAATGKDSSITASGSVTTAGTDSEGIFATAGTGSVTISNGAAIATSGEKSEGVIARADSNISITNTGGIATQGDYATGIDAKSFASAVGIQSSGAIRVSGDHAHAVQAYGVGDVEIRVDDATASGFGGAGVYATSQGGAVAVLVTGAVQGGTGSQAGNGIALGAAKDSTITIDAGGSVGALSDIAIVAAADAKTSVFNDGTITGSVFFGGKDDLFSNGGLVELRALTDGQTEGVAFVVFDAGKDTFSNFGTLSLGNADGASIFVTGNQIAHPAGGNSDITQAGVEQAHISRLELFENFGLITLQDGVAGDLIAITDAAVPDVGGNGEFRSEGGALALDVVLDDGSSKQSDMLVLDNATTGTGGATRVFIANAGGSGGQTTGDGIRVINIDGKSTADAFAAGNLAVAGAYQYDLVFQNAAKTDQNWYLQSSFFEGSLEYPAISSGALVTWYSDLGALGDELRKRRAQVAAQEAALGQVAELPGTATDMADVSSVRMQDGGGSGGWFRVSGADLDIEQSGPADFEVNTTRAEAGFDVGFNGLIGEAEDWLVAGAFAGYGWSSVGFDSGSDVDFDVATLGAYATYFRGPYYLDALVKLDWPDGSFNSEAVSQDGDVSLPVFGLSLESGYRFDLTAGGLYLQPQAQLAFAHAGGDSFKDDSGATIELGDSNSLRGRVGARIGQELTSGPATGNFYLEAAVNQEFLGETEAKVSGLTLEQELPETTFQVGAGFDIALPADGVSFTVDADYTFGDEAEGIAATGGLRISW